MVEDYKVYDPSWCPGCGNFMIRDALKQALEELEIPPKDTVIVSGIGQAAKMPHYIGANGFNGLHGRALPPAIGMKLSNKNLNIIVESGDGDTYGEGRYKRYEFTKNGVSKRLIPGKQDHLVLVDSHEHNEYGNIDENIENRIKMVDKRMAKFESLKDEIREPWYLGAEEPKNLFVCFGATYGAIKELINRLFEEGISAGALVYGDIWPFPTKNLEKYRHIADKVINVEQNNTSQLKGLIHEYTDIKCTHSILKYDGRAMNSQYIYDKFKKLSF